MRTSVFIASLVLLWASPLWAGSQPGSKTLFQRTYRLTRPDGRTAHAVLNYSLTVEIDWVEHGDFKVFDHRTCEVSAPFKWLIRSISVDYGDGKQPELYGYTTWARPTPGYPKTIDYNCNRMHDDDLNAFMAWELDRFDDETTIINGDRPNAESVIGQLGTYTLEQSPFGAQ